eukprot:1136143-Pelagomonas_calceolata.AAC.2
MARVKANKLAMDVRMTCFCPEAFDCLGSRITAGCQFHCLPTTVAIGPNAHQKHTICKSRQDIERQDIDRQDIGRRRTLEDGGRWKTEDVERQRTLKDRGH